jgi:hypothetical protein
LPGWLFAILNSSEQSLLEANLSRIADRLLQFRVFTVFISLPLMTIVTVLAVRVLRVPKEDEYSLGHWLLCLIFLVLYLGYACAFDNVLFRSGAEYVLLPSGSASARFPADLVVVVGLGGGASAAMLGIPYAVASIVRRSRPTHTTSHT